jgi:hypothetical protein
MSSILKVDTIQDQSGNNIINENADTITIGASGDTISIPSGATIDASGATLTLPTTIEVDTIEPQSGTSLTLGASGDTITIPSGATLTNSGTATGFGKVLQVVTATDSTQRSSSSTTFITGSNTLTITITPSSATNKIFLIGTISVNAPSADLHLTIFRDATNIGNATGGLAKDRAENGSAISILDSPNTTSSITYQVYFRNSTANTGYINTSLSSSITAFEIAG